MKRLIFPIIPIATAVAIALPASVSSMESGWFATAVAQEGTDDMVKVRIILKKLRDAMASMKDLDELEASGMPKKDVDRMRSAMQIKINQMMGEAMEDIRSL